MLDHEYAKRAPHAAVATLAVLVLMACGLASFGCYNAKIYSPPVDSFAYRLFDRYSCQIRLNNLDAPTFNRPTRDENCEVSLRVILDSSLTHEQDRDTGRVVRIADLCIAGECFTPVYCPPVAYDDTRTGYDSSGGKPTNFHYDRRYNFGWMRIPDECDSIEIKFDAELVDKVADTLLAVQTVRLFLPKRQWYYPAWLPI